VEQLLPVCHNFHHAAGVAGGKVLGNEKNENSGSGEKKTPSRGTRTEGAGSVRFLSSF